MKIVTARLHGEWLAENGFVEGAAFTLVSEPGMITLKLREKLEKQGTVRKGGYIFVPLTSIEEAGFDVIDRFAATYEYGLIKLQKHDTIPGADKPLYFDKR